MLFLVFALASFSYEPGPWAPGGGGNRKQVKIQRIPAHPPPPGTKSPGSKLKSAEADWIRSTHPGHTQNISTRRYGEHRENIGSSQRKKPPNLTFFLLRALCASVVKFFQENKIRPLAIGPASDSIKRKIVRVRPF